MSVRDHFQPGSGDRWEARLRAREWLADAEDVAPGADLVALAARNANPPEQRDIVDELLSRPELGSQLTALVVLRLREALTLWAERISRG